MPTQVVEAHSDVVVISKEKDTVVISWIMGIVAIAVLVGVVVGYYSPDPDTKSPKFIGAGVLLEVIRWSLAFCAGGAT